jgi:hypothetical protein
MNAEHILEEFIKFAQFNNAIPGLGQSNVIQPQILSGQPPKRTSNVTMEYGGDRNGNTVTVKPATNSKKVNI